MSQSQILPLTLWIYILLSWWFLAKTMKMMQKTEIVHKGASSLWMARSDAITLLLSLSVSLVSALTPTSLFSDTALGLIIKFLSFFLDSLKARWTTSDASNQTFFFFYQSNVLPVLIWYHWKKIFVQLFMLWKSLMRSYNANTLMLLKTRNY